MKKTIIKLIPTFLTFLLVLNSCGVDSKNNKNTTDINTNLIKSFKTQSLPILKDPDDSIEIVEKDSDVPIKMTIAREYPKNVPVKFKGVGILPISRTPTTIQPIPEQELKKMREAQFKVWSDWFERNYKLIRSSFIKINKQIDKAFKEEFELELKKHSKKSKERENIEKLYEIKEKASHKKEKEALELLEKGYKDTLAKARINIVEIHHDNDDHHFKVKGWGEDLWNGFVDFCVKAADVIKTAVIENPPSITVFGLVNTIINDISKLVNNVVQTPKTDPPPVFNSELSNIGKQTTTFETNPDYSKPLLYPQRQIVSKTDSVLPRAVLQSASVNDLIYRVNQTIGSKIVIPIQLSSLFQAIPSISEASPFIGQRVLNKICSKSYTSGGNEQWSCSDENIPDGIGAVWLEEEDLVNGKIIFKMAFIGDKNDPELWVKTLIEKYRNNFDSSSMQVIENNESKLVDLIRSSDVSAKLESPKICNQKITTSFDSGGFVNFQGKIGKGLIYDGEYTFSLSFKNKKSKEEIIIKLQNINILQLLKNSRIFDINGNLINYPQSSPLEISPLNLYDTKGDLSLSDIDGYKLDSGDIGFYALNNTPNLWDLRIRRVSSESCLNVYYQAHCLDLKSGDLLFKKSFFDTGIYKLETNYSTYPEIKGIDTATLKKESDFMMLNIDYSTFARKSSKAEMMRVNSEIVKDSVSPSISINKFQGINQYYNPIDGVSSDPYDLPPLTIDTIPEPNTIRATSLVNNVLKKGSGLAVEGNNLFIDLAKSHSQPNITESNYDAFYGVSLPSCTKNSFVNVGAVIDITNGIYINNKPLYDKNISLPLIMQIVKKDPSNTQYGYVPIKSWSFNAKIGSHTVIQEYWNGSTDQVGNPSTLPDYKSGEYLVKIFLNNDLMPSTLRDISNKFDIHVSKPAIASSSTDSKIIVNEDNSCPNPEIKIISADLTNDERISIIGELKNENIVDYNKINVDFFGDLDNLQIKTIEPLQNNQFKIIFEAPKTTNSYATKVNNSGGFSEINLKLSYCNTGNCLESNIATLNERVFDGQYGSVILADGPLQSFQTAAISNTQSDSCREKGIAPLTDKRNVIIETPFSIFDTVDVNNILGKIVKKISAGTYKFKIYNKKTGKTVFSDSVNFDGTNSSSPNIAKIQYNTTLPSGYSAFTPNISLFYKWNGRNNQVGQDNGKLVLTDPYVSTVVFRELYIKSFPSGFVYRYEPSVSIKNDQEYFIMNMDQYQKIADDLRSGSWSYFIKGKRVNSTIGSYRLEAPKLQTVGEGNAHSGFPTVEGVKSFSEYGKKPNDVNTPRNRVFPPSTTLDYTQNPPTPKSENDAERKMVEDSAYIINNISGVQAYYRNNIDKVVSSISGRLMIYADRTTCTRCQELQPQFRSIYPNIDLVWVDHDTYECY